MKRIVTLIAVCLIALTSVAGVKIGDLYYNLNESWHTAEVTCEKQFLEPGNYSSLRGAVTIPNKVVHNSVTYVVTEIGSDAFHDCIGITSVTIPEGVSQIERDAFANCTNLTSFVIPNSVTAIRNAFRGCTGLTSITISKKVNVIDVGTFANCPNMTSIIVDKHNKSYCSIDGVLFSKDKKKLVSYPGGKRGSYTVPDKVTKIASYAFACYGRGALETVYIPQSVLEIGDYAFQDAQSLTKIEVATSNPNYSSQNGVLFDKNKTTLIAFPAGKKGTYTAPSGVKTIGKYAFAFCTGLTSITLGQSVTTIQENAFSFCENLTSVTIPNKNVRFADDAFSGDFDVTVYTSVEMSIPGLFFTQVKRIPQQPQQNTTTATTPATVQDPEYVDLGLPSGTLWKKRNEEIEFLTHFDNIDLEENFGCCVPTKQQFEELKNYCTWKWQRNGCVVTGRNGNSIFLPAAGYSDLGKEIFGEAPDGEGIFGAYWSSTKSDFQVNEEYFFSLNFFEQGGELYIDISPTSILQMISVRLVKRK